MTKICPYCNKSIIGKHAIYANHIRWCNKNPNLNKEKTSKNISHGVLQNLEKKLGKFKKFLVKCHNCGKPFDVEEREKQFPKKEKYFCNISCANTRHHSEKIKSEIRKNTSIAIKKLWQDPEYVTLSAKHSIFTSKGEVAIRKYFQWNFPQERWTFGGCLRYNGFPLVRDLYSNKLKVCIEYDGIWHFEDIHGQLEYKQKQDQTMEDWCLQNNFKLIRIREEVFLKDEDFWINQIVKEVHSSISRIVKFY